MHLLLKAKLEQNIKTAGGRGNVMFRYCTQKKKTQMLCNQ